MAQLTAKNIHARSRVSDLALWWCVRNQHRQEHSPACGIVMNEDDCLPKHRAQRSEKYSHILLFAVISYCFKYLCLCSVRIVANIC